MKRAKRVKMEESSKEQDSTGSMVFIPDKSSGRPADELVRTCTTLSIQKREEDSAVDGLVGTRTTLSAQRRISSNEEDDLVGTRTTLNYQKGGGVVQDDILVNEKHKSITSLVTHVVQGAKARVEDNSRERWMKIFRHNEKVDDKKDGKGRKKGRRSLANRVVDRKNNKVTSLVHQGKQSWLAKWCKNKVQV